MKTIILCAFLLFLAPLSLAASEVETIDKDGLKMLLGSDSLVIIDVRTGGDWSSSEYKIKGAVRVDPEEMSSWAAARARDKIYVLYCA